MSRRAAALLVLLGACAQPPIALPPPLPEDCGLTEQDREDLERWERQMFEPMRELDAQGAITLDDGSMPQASEQHCSIHGDALEVLPAIAVPGLQGVGFFTTSDRITIGNRERFSIATWEDRHGPRGADESRLVVCVGCYLREPFVPVLACTACRDEYRQWCREYLEERDRWLEEFTDNLAQVRRECWHVHLATLRGAPEID